MNLKQKPRCSFHVAHGPPNIVWLSQAFNVAFYLWNLLWQTVWDVYLMLLYLIAKKFWNVLRANLPLLLVNSSNRGWWEKGVHTHFQVIVILIDSPFSDRFLKAP